MSLLQSIHLILFACLMNRKKNNIGSFYFEWCQSFRYFDVNSFNHFVILTSIIPIILLFWRQLFQTFLLFWHQSIRYFDVNYSNHFVILTSINSLFWRQLFSSFSYFDVNYVNHFVILTSITSIISLFWRQSFRYFEVNHFNHFVILTSIISVFWHQSFRYFTSIISLYADVTPLDVFTFVYWRGRLTAELMDPINKLK